MPVLTEPGEDGVVTAWLVDENQQCEAGLLIAEVQVEKVADQIYAPDSGWVIGRVPINEAVPQGEPICRIEATATSDGSPTPDAGEASQKQTQAVPASPSARRVARELGIDLGSVTGSGSEGRITEADVRAEAQDLSAPATGVELTGLRAAIARNMRRGHLETAPVTLTSTVDLTSGPPEQFTASLVRAVAVVLIDHPGLSGTREGNLFAQAQKANISVAVQTDGGLVAPVVVDPAGKTVTEINEEITSLAERANRRQLQASDYEGGTFTVTNLGSYDVDAFTPIINFPQVAILGAGAIRKEPIIDPDGSVVSGSRVVLSLTFDHAFVDGVPAAAFLRQVAETLAAGTF